METALDGEDQGIAGTRRLGREQGLGLKCLVENLDGVHAGQLELSEPLLLFRSPRLAQIERAEEQFAMPFEQNMRCQLHASAIVSRGDKLPMGNCRHDLQTRLIAIVHLNGSPGDVAMQHEGYCVQTQPLWGRRWAVINCPNSAKRPLLSRCSEKGSSVAIAR